MDALMIGVSVEKEILMYLRHSLLCQAALFSGLIVMLGVMNAPAAPPPGYRLVDLGESVGGLETVALTVNDSGAVLISDVSGAGYKTFVWQPGNENPQDGTISEIAVPEMRRWRAMAMDNQGRILFHRRQRTPIDGGLVLWTPLENARAEAEFVALPPPAEKARVNTEAILTPQGEVLGEYFDEKRQAWVGLKWTLRPGSAEMALIEFSEQETGRFLRTPVGRNDKGWVISNTNVPAGVNIWRPTDDPNIGTLHRIAPDTDVQWVTLLAMNNHSQIVASSPQHESWVFQIDDELRTTSSWTIKKPENLPGTLKPKLINQQGVVIGWVEGAHTSFYWTAESGTHDLGTLVEDLPPDWHLQALSINDKGWIAGVALVGRVPTPRGEAVPRRRAFVLIPRSGH